jgi:RNA polymerase sigma-32 factor
VKVATTKAQRKLFFNLRSMKTALAPLSGDDIERVATALNVKPQEVVEMETRLSGRDLAFEPDDDDDAYAPAQYLADHESEPSLLLEAEETEQVRATGLAQALGGLDARSRRIIEARWLREKDTATLHELAAEFGVSAERIRQIEAKALEKMRKAISQSETPRKLPARATA